jgi:four helix bundle protein
MLRTYKDLDVWKKAYELCLAFYRCSASFPRDEIYGLTAQMRRAAVSVISNIAEGYGRRSRKEYVQMLNVAYGSLNEFEAQLMLAHDLRYMPDADFQQLQDLLGQAERMLMALIRALDRKE